MSFIIQVARLADEVGWLEHELELSAICGADLTDQPERIRNIADRINTIADRIRFVPEVKEAA